MHFKQEILSGWGNLPKSPTKISSFQSAGELQGALQYAKLIARGLGRSFADQATNTDNFAVDFSSFNRFLDFDSDFGILECEAGTSLEKIIRFLGPRGWFPMVCPETQFVTIGGAIANDIHGKAHTVDGSFANCVEEISILSAKGEIVTANKEKNEDLFRANFGGLGLLGFLLSAQLRLKRIDTTYFEQLSVPVRNLTEMMEMWQARQKDFVYSSAWIDVTASGNRLGRGVIHFGNQARIDELPFSKMIEPIWISERRRFTLPFFLPSPLANPLVSRAINKAINLKNKRGGRISSYNDFFFRQDRVNNWNRIFGKKGFVQYQLVLPMENSLEGIGKILSEVVSGNCAPAFTRLKRFGKSNSGLLSFPIEGYSLSVYFPFSPELKSFCKKLNHMVVDAGGRVYMAKDAFLDEESFKKMYPQWEEWAKVKAKYDPDNIFSSDLSRRIGLC